jgi:hypothetical protein
MQFVPASPNHSAQVKALVEKRHSLSLGTFVCFFVPNQEFDLLGEQTADRSLSSGGENLGLPEHLPAKADRHVLLLTIS